MDGPAKRASIRIPLDDDARIRKIQGTYTADLEVGKVSYTDTVLMLVRRGMDAWEASRCPHKRELSLVSSHDVPGGGGVWVICPDCQTVLRRVNFLGTSNDAA